MFAGTYAPVNWLLCRGQTLPISEFEVLFNLIGTTYGGDGQETFMLPDLQGRLPVHQGKGMSGSAYTIGEPFGTESVTLNPQQLPVHNHSFLASTAPGNAASPSGAVLASAPSITMFLRDGPSTALPSTAVAPYGGSQPHENRAPVLAINYIISLLGVFPHQ